MINIYIGVRLRFKQLIKMCRIPQSLGYWFCWICPLHKIMIRMLGKLHIPVYETACKVCLANYIIKKGVEENG